MKSKPTPNTVTAFLSFFNWTHRTWPDRETVIVGAGTAILFAAALSFVLRFAANGPVVDEWDLTQVVLGGMTLSEWTFTRLNEHLFIPANALWYMTMTVSGLNFRAGMIINLLLHLTASIMLLAAARRIRGTTSLLDLAFPAAMLHWGHAYNLLMSYQLAFGLFALSASAMLWVIATAKPGHERRTALRGSLVLLVLMLNGGMGIAFVPPLTIWILVLAWRARALGPVAFVLLAAGYTLWALLSAPDVAAAPKGPLPIGQLAWCVVQYLGMGLGLWYDGPHWPRNGLVLTSAFLVMAIGLMVACIRLSDGGRSAGLLAFLAGHLAVAAGIAYSRGGGIAERYVTISAVGLCGLLLAGIHLMPRLPRIVTAIFGALIMLLILVNASAGERYGQTHRAIYRSFERDLREGMPARYLCDKYQTLLRVGDNLIPALERLKTSPIPLYGNLKTEQVTEQEHDVIITHSERLSSNGIVRGLLVEVEQAQVVPVCEVSLRWAGGESRIFPPRTPGVFVRRLWINADVRDAVISASPTLKIRRAAWLQ